MNNENQNEENPDHEEVQAQQDSDHEEVQAQQDSEHAEAQPREDAEHEEAQAMVDADPQHDQAEPEIAQQEAQAESSEQPAGEAAGASLPTEAAPEVADAANSPWVYNLIDADIAAAVGKDLCPAAKKFYELYGDNYDFLYFIADYKGHGQFIDVGDGSGYREGLSKGSQEDSRPKYGTPTPKRLKGVVRMTIGDNGPAIHEAFHYWGTFYGGSKCGFDPEFFPHWGVSSVKGTHGGFDRSTLVDTGSNNKSITDAPRFGTKAAGATKHFEAAAFEPEAPCHPSGFADAVPLADIELYMMGLLPASAVKPILVVNGVSNVKADKTRGVVRFDATGYHEVTIEMIQAAAGKVPYPAAQKAFRSAFVLVTPKPADADTLSKVETLAKVFGNEMAHPRSKHVLSFEKATRGLATMSVRLEPRR